jgi:hypothetical protein
MLSDCQSIKLYEKSYLDEPELSISYYEANINISLNCPVKATSEQEAITKVMDYISLNLSDEIKDLGEYDIEVTVTETDLYDE